MMNSFTLKTHISTVHENTKPFKCEPCNTSFGFKSQLEVHITIVHESKKAFKCGLCNKEFAEKGNLKQHVDSIHEKLRVKCHVCHKEYNILALRRHLKDSHENARIYHKCEL